ncbi:hypothetical protein [Streptococcus parasanguinis]|uniref:hypothetical protein n=1 Tax=Streptococcus parasanguinis TaxID=1318 RepID=UPI0039C0A5FD
MKGSKHNMREFTRTMLSVWYISIGIVVIIIVSLTNSIGTSMSYSEREQQLLRKQNNPLGYKDNEVVEKIIVDKGTNNYDIQHILEDKDEMKSYYIVVWNEGNSMKRYKKVDRDYFKKVHPGDTWDEKNDDTSTDYYEW